MSLALSASASDAVLLERLRRAGIAMPTVRPVPGAPSFRLEFSGDRLCLVESSNRRARPFFVDLARARRPGGGADLLRRALGAPGGTIVDATAGFGGDTVHLARSGYAVIAVERCAVIAAMLADGLERLAEPAVRDRIDLLAADSREILPRLSADVVYLDPMFDAGAPTKSLSRRAMVLARTLAGEDDDAAELLDLARARFPRVVVKRPDKAPPLAAGVHHDHRGRTVRYDVYLDHRRSWAFEAGTVAVDQE